jgi:hypothetical protein
LINILTYKFNKYNINGTYKYLKHKIKDTYRFNLSIAPICPQYYSIAELVGFTRDNHTPINTKVLASYTKNTAYSFFKLSKLCRNSASITSYCHQSDRQSNPLAPCKKFSRKFNKPCQNHGVLAVYLPGMAVSLAYSTRLPPPLKDMNLKVVLKNQGGLQGDPHGSSECISRKNRCLRTSLMNSSGRKYFDNGRQN